MIKCHGVITTSENVLASLSGNRMDNCQGPGPLSQHQRQSNVRHAQSAPLLLHYSSPTSLSKSSGCGAWVESAATSDLSISLFRFPLTFETSTLVKIRGVSLVQHLPRSTTDFPFLINPLDLWLWENGKRTKTIIYLDVPQRGHQTWLAGKSPKYGGL